MKKNYKGGILLTTLLFVFLFAFLFNLVLDTFELTRKFDEKTTQFYCAKSMVCMVLEEVKNQTLSLEQGNQSFTDGEVSYQRKENVLLFTVITENQTYFFEEEISWQ